MTKQMTEQIDGMKLALVEMKREADERYLEFARTQIDKYEAQQNAYTKQINFLMSKLEEDSKRSEEDRADLQRKISELKAKSMNAEKEKNELTDKLEKTKREFEKEMKDFSKKVFDLSIRDATQPNEAKQVEEDIKAAAKKQKKNTCVLS